MPYIDPQHRPPFEAAIKNITEEPLTSGELNYIISKIINEDLAHKGISYTSINEAIGILECAKLELYARIARPYEDSKIKSNGDVYNVQVSTD